MIPTVTTHTETTWLENAPADAPCFSPSPSVEEFMQALVCGEPEPMRLIMLQGPRGEGKVNRVNDLVLTPSGWTKAGDVRVGDDMIAGNGTVTTVVGVYPQPSQAMWRLMFSDGTEFVTSDDHLWAVETGWDRVDHKKVRPSRAKDDPSRAWTVPRAPRDGLRVVTTKEIRGRLQSGAWKSGGRWSIPLMSGPAQFPERPVPLDPYLLGVLLGDGHMGDTVTLASADLDLVEAVRAALPDGVRLNARAARYVYGVVGHPVYRALVVLGLTGHRAWEKFIPDAYLWNAPTVRLAMLQGLLDTDGTVLKHSNSVSYSTTSERLAEGVEFLVRSLGGLTRRRMRQTYYTYKGERRAGRPSYHISVRLPNGVAPFRLARKAAHVSAKGQRNEPRRYIVGCEPDTADIGVCFQVAHPSHLYVAHDFIVTHNTTAGIWGIIQIAQRMASEGKGRLLPIRVAVIRDTWANLERALSLDSLVLTPTGWVKAGDIAVGDRLIAKDGTPTSVLGVYPHSARPLWKVRFSDGTSARVTDHHLWAVLGRWDRESQWARNRRCRRSGWLPAADGLSIVQTEQIRARLSSAKRRRPAWEIPLVDPVQFPSAPVPLDPYLLGVLLGDGGLSQHSVRLTTSDEDIVRQVLERCPAGVGVRHVAGYDYRITGGRGAPNPVLDALRDLGLHGLKSPEKFIPAGYLWNDAETRLALLRGLMDTDGHASRERGICFASTSERLIEGVEFLVRSLGGVTSRSTTDRVGRWHQDRRGRRIIHRYPLTKLTIQLPPHIAPFMLPRKADRLVGRRRTPHRWIVGIEPDGEGQAVCFRIEHPSHLFVANDFIVTHNTTLVSFEENAQKGMPLQFLNGRKEAKIGNWVHVYFFGLDNRQDCDKLQGFQCGVLWLEEVAPAAELAVGIPSESLAIGITSIRQPGVPKRVIVTFNPPDEDHWIMTVEKTLTDSGQRDILTHKCVIPAGEKSAHFRAMSALAAKNGATGRATEWDMAAKEFDAYRRRNELALEAIGRWDLVDRLVKGKVGGVALGEALVPYFNRDVHVTREPILPIPGALMVRGWDGGLCVSKDTELLTLNGWMLMKDLNPSAPIAVATRSHDGRLEFQVPTRYVRQPYVGPMVQYQNQNVDFCLTPEHLVPVETFTGRNALKTDTGVWRRVSAEGLATGRYKYAYVPLRAQWAATSRERYGPHGWSAPVYAAFLGWYISEGHTSRRRIVISQHGPHAALEAALRATGLSWKPATAYGKPVGWRVTDAALVAYLAPLGHAREKRVHPDAWTLSAPDLGLFIDAMVAGDGHTRRNRRRGIERNINTSSVALAGDLQGLAMMAGYYARVFTRPAVTKTITDRGGRQHIANGGVGYRISLKTKAARAWLDPKRFAVVPYDDLTYCVTVPNGSLYIRRNGIAHWNGNTPSTVFCQIRPSGGIDVLGSITSISTGMADHIRREVYCLTPDHRVLTDDLRWVPVGDINPGDPLLGFDEKGPSRRFLSSVAIGCLPRKAEVYRVVLSDGTELKATGQHPWIAVRNGLTAHAWIRTDQLRVGDALPKFFEPWPTLTTYDAGWLAGMMDGEGSLGIYNGHPRISVAQQPGAVMDRMVELLKRLDVPHRVQVDRPVHYVHIEAKHAIGMALGMLRPVRLGAPSGRQWGYLVRFARPTVEAVEGLGMRDIVTMGTSTETYVAEGFGAHNTWQEKKRILPKRDIRQDGSGGFGHGQRQGWDFRDIGDPALLQGNQVTRAELTAGLVIENLLGTSFEPGPIEWSARREALLLAFSRNIGGPAGRSRPFIRLDGTTFYDENSRVKLWDENKLLIQGLGGRAHYPVDPNTGRINDSILAAKRVCVDEATEILTPDGWRRHDALEKGQRVYGYHLGQGKIIDTTLIDIHRISEPGPALAFESDSLHMVVTPNHRCVVRRRLSRRGRSALFLPPELVAATDLLSSHSLVRTGVRSIRPTLSDEIVRLCAWVMTEGSYLAGQSITLVQSYTANLAYVESIDRLAGRVRGMSRLGPRGHGMVAWSIAGDTAALIRLLMPEKIPTAALWERLSPQQALLFLYEAARGDGHWHDKPPGWSAPEPPARFWHSRANFFHGAHVSIWQMQEAAAEALQIIATLAGVPARLRKSGPGHVVALSNHRDLTAVDALERRQVDLPFCWCPQTGTGTWIARRDGRVFITGNSHIYMQALDALAYILAVLCPAGEFMRREPPRRDTKTKAPRPTSWVGL